MISWCTVAVYVVADSHTQSIWLVMWLTWKLIQCLPIRLPRTFRAVQQTAYPFVCIIQQSLSVGTIAFLVWDYVDDSRLHSVWSVPTVLSYRWNWLLSVRVSPSHSVTFRGFVAWLLWLSKVSCRSLVAYKTHSPTYRMFYLTASANCSVMLVATSYPVIEL